MCTVVNTSVVVVQALSLPQTNKQLSKRKRWLLTHGNASVAAVMISKVSAVCLNIRKEVLRTPRLSLSNACSEDIHFQPGHVPSTDLVAKAGCVRIIFVDSSSNLIAIICRSSELEEQLPRISAKTSQDFEVMNHEHEFVTKKGVSLQM